MQLVNLSQATLQLQPATAALMDLLQDPELKDSLKTATLYHDFPLFRDEDGDLLRSKLLLVSPIYGVVLFGVCDAAGPDALDVLKQADATLEQVFSSLYARLLRNKELRQSKTTLAVKVHAAIFAPNITSKPDFTLENELLRSAPKTTLFLRNTKSATLSEALFLELTATVEGSKAILRPKVRTTGDAKKSLGILLSNLESEIAGFDAMQRHGYVVDIDGPQRIRGLAGSGKTIVLAMKAALTHLRYPTEKILYTFYTKSLYQHIRRLITRFYRQFDDRDPDWEQLHILHGWGGQNTPGVYYETCVRNNVTPMSFAEASRNGPADPFDYACRKLETETEIASVYDYVFVDEGQDFPASFIRLCANVAKRRRFVYAYDDLQTIFRPHSPSPDEIFGVDDDNQSLLKFAEDIVLYKCYRNPREIIVTAHALGFGLYGRSIVQMLESIEHWNDIGYTVLSPSLRPGLDVEIERPANNSLSTVSNSLTPDQIVQVFVEEDIDSEVAHCVNRIAQNIKDGARPDDILVVCVDDRNAKDYLWAIESELEGKGISSNNIHADPTGVRDFYQSEAVTLSTVHKAKGNECFIVYVVGVDALFGGSPGVRARNMIFTAITRAKAMAIISGIGDAAKACQLEVTEALKNYPILKFKYPSPAQLKGIKRDLQQRSADKQAAERRLDDVLQVLSKDEIEAYLHRAAKKRPRPRAPESED